MITPEMEEWVGAFDYFDDWETRYTYLIDLGKAIDGLEEADKTEENKVHGCTSQVWMTYELGEGKNPKLYFKADSDAFIVRGLIAILTKVYSGRTAQEITQIDIEHLFNKIGFNSFLSPTRSNGFFSMVEKIKAYAQSAV